MMKSRKGRILESNSPSIFKPKIGNKERNLERPEKGDLLSNDIYTNYIFFPQILVTLNFNFFDLLILESLILISNSFTNKYI